MDKKNRPKVLYLDIESSRMIVEFPTYNLWNIKYIDPKYIKHDWYITCAAWATLDLENQKMGKIETVAVNDFSSYKRDFRDDKGVVKALHKAISNCDLLIGHNLDAFDVKKINTKFVQYGLQPVDWPKTVDTLKVNKKYRKSSSNSLAHVAAELGVSRKMDLPSSVMWDADAGCEKSLKKLIKYNKQDVKTGAEVYFKLLPYIPNHFNMNALSKKEGIVCKNCGSDHLRSNGWRVTATARYRRYRCLNCGATTRDKKSDKVFNGR